jgi:serine/threonine-protein kinase
MARGRVGPYEIRRFLGRGATGSVYACRHAVLGRDVAVKLLHPHLALDRVASARFTREGQAAARIRHPCVVEVFDVGEHEGIPFLVMELVEGDDLATHLHQRGPLPIGAIADVMLGVVAGVAAAHQAGVVHRDLKPANIRLGTDHLGHPRAKVLDFGISKMNDCGLGELTDTDRALGTTSYMAPEQLRSAKHVDERSDVYGLGVILYECITGRLPFEADGVYDRMHAILTESVAPPRAFRPEVPPSLEALVLRAMDRAPEDRLPSARLLGQELAAFASDSAHWRREFAAFGRAEIPASHPDADAIPSSGMPTIPGSGDAAYVHATHRLGLPASRRASVLWLAGLLTVVAIAAFVILRVTRAPRGPDLFAIDAGQALPAAPPSQWSADLQEQPSRAPEAAASGIGVRWSALPPSDAPSTSASAPSPPPLRPERRVPARPAASASAPKADLYDHM